MSETDELVVAALPGPLFAGLWIRTGRGAPRDEGVRMILVTFLVRLLGTVVAMNRPWSIELTMDAIGHEDTQVRVGRTGPAGSMPHLTVRTGSVLLYCMGPRAVTDLAAAWAAAKVRGEDLLPGEAYRAPVDRGGPAAYPIGEVVLDGAQPWRIITPRAALDPLVVQTGPLTVRVHDRVALDTQLRTWAEATARAAQIYGDRAPNFSRLLAQARLTAIDDASRTHNPKGLGRNGPDSGRSRG